MLIIEITKVSKNPRSTMNLSSKISISNIPKSVQDCSEDEQDQCQGQNGYDSMR
jgi:hypothetical protein|tara:strand:+ start:1033 stop:1194 length:162 start_codon:yes stop_codon:yes gene_type:complete